MDDLEVFALKKERKLSFHKRYLKFEHNLRYLLCELKEETTREDDFLLLDIKQSIIVFIMKERSQETNEIFLENMKHDFYNSIKELEKNHPDINTFYIKLFMEDFYF